MLLPLIALEDYVDIKISAEKLAEKLLLSGTKVEEITKISGKTVFNLEITPNRADCLSFYGIAREIAAGLEINLKQPDTDLLVNLKPLSNKVAFKVQSKKLCPYYSVVKLTNLKVAESPEWIKETLSLSGIRPINNLVDITNLVMLELGQPMHAFDANKIKGTLILRASKKGEKVETLDSIERELPEGSIVIEDSEKLVDLAGLMGGKNSEVDKNTNELILLVPFYDSLAIRKASIFTLLRTEASNRFEKNLDPNLHSLAINRAIKLLSENASAKLGSAITSVGFPQKLRSINFDFRLVKNILGIDLEKSDFVNLLSPLGFMVREGDLVENSLRIDIPSFRPDVSLPEDILEEVGRTFGYNNFPKTLPEGEIPVQKELFKADNEKLARNYLINNGFQEITGYSLVSEADLKKIEFESVKIVKVLHPTSSDFAYLRPTLLINLLKVFATNKSYSKLNFFELAKEYKKEIDSVTKLPSQKNALVFGSTSSFGSTKSVLETLLSHYQLNYTIVPLATDSLWLFGADYLIDGQKIARIGWLQERILANFDLKINPAVAWMNFDFLANLNQSEDYKIEPKFPSVIEDISFFIKKSNRGGEILNFIQNFDKLIYRVQLLDIFQKSDQNSLTFRMEFNDPGKTLTNQEVSKLRLRLEQSLTEKFQLVLRKD